MILSSYMDRDCWVSGALFVWLISHRPTVLFFQNKPATNNQPAVLFTQNKSTPATSHQPNEQAVGSVFDESLGQKRFVLAAKTGFCWRARHPPATLSQ
jgi:hypothetical protein